MTTQATPPSEAQQLADARTAAHVAQALADDYRALLDAITAALDAAGVRRDLPTVDRVRALVDEHDAARREDTDKG